MTMSKPMHDNSSTASALAEEIAGADHMVLMHSAPNPDDDMTRQPISADDEQIIIEALLFYALWRAEAVEETPSPSSEASQRGSQS
jgi:hypothetical protein